MGEGCLEAAFVKDFTYDLKIVKVYYKKDKGRAHEDGRELNPVFGTNTA